jgi:caa(3)-type oxidase subunit IV
MSQHDRETVHAGHAGAHAAALESQHPTPATYVRIAAVLGVITAIEVAVFYIGALRPVLAPILLVLSASKFVLVVGFYMHLRFDSKFYRNLFVFGLFVAASILLALLVINSYHAPVPGAGVV